MPIRWSSAILATLLALLCVPACKNSKMAPADQAANPASPANVAAAPEVAASVPKTDMDAISDAIQLHLRSNRSVNLSAMDSSIEQVSINGDQATAGVLFRLKQGGASMMMTYHLERHTGSWMVVHSEPTGGQFAHPPVDKTQPGAAAPGAAAGMPDVTDYLKSLPAGDASSKKSQP